MEVVEDNCCLLGELMGISSGIGYISILKFLLLFTLTIFPFICRSENNNSNLDRMLGLGTLGGKWGPELIQIDHPAF